ncbi:PD-(D/E)XK nuclease family protein, partial [bacterium]
ASDAVTIATIHWAKGREWPAVFIADVSTNVFPAYHSPGTIVWDHGERAPLITRDLDGAPTYHALWARFGLGGDAGEDAWKARELAEERRLFYVALTRARDRVYVCGTVTERGNGEESCSEFLSAVRNLPGTRSIAAPSTPEVRTAAVTLADGSRDDGTLVALLRQQDEREATLSRTVTAERSADGGRVLSFTALDAYATCPLRYSYEEVLRLPGLARSAVSGAHDDVNAAEYGTLIHVTLERYNLAQLDGGKGDLPAALESSLEELGLRGRLGAERLAAARAALAAYRRHPIAQAQVLGAEVPFSLELGGVTLAGAIDLVAELNGRALVIDYKTGGGDLEHYGLQLAIYREAAARLFGRRPWETLLLLIRDGTVREVHPSEAEADAAQRVREIAGLIARNEYPARPGPACATCPYRDQPCTAYQALTR